MKTTLLCAITVAVAALTFASAAYGQYKAVGDDGITASPRLRQALNERHSSVATTKAATPAMACPKCADFRTTKVSPQAKGGEIMMGVKQVTYKHACMGCDIKLTVVGEGKAKHQVATRKCTPEKASNFPCCATR